MAVRFDVVQVTTPTIDPKTGIMRCKGTIARSGIQEYRNADGSVRREFRPPEEVEKSAASFKDMPITLNHPPEMVNSENAVKEQYMRGMSGAVTYDEGLLNAELTIVDKEAVQSAQTTHKQLSNGYECDIDETPGQYQGQQYDCVQRNIRGNHIALVRRARAGDVAKIHQDSADEPEQNWAISTRFDSEDAEISFNSVSDCGSGNTKSQKSLLNLPSNRMATLRLDGVEYSDIPESFAAIASQKFSQLEQERKRNDQLETELSAKAQAMQDLESEADDLRDERDRERGRADALEIQVEELSYQIQNGESEDRTDANEDSQPRYDDADIATAIGMGIEAGIAAREEAYDLLDAHGVDIEGIEFDPGLTPSEVQATVLGILSPNLNLDSVDDEALSIYVQARYDALFDAVPEAEEDARFDSEEDYTQDSRDAVVAHRKKSMTGNRQQEAMDEGCRMKMDAYKTPLSMSKRK